MNKTWRPEDWDKIVKQEYYDGGCVYREIDTFEAGADAMLKAMFELAKESPTGKFEIDSKAVQIYGVEDE